MCGHSSSPVRDVPPAFLCCFLYPSSHSIPIDFFKLQYKLHLLYQLSLTFMAFSIYGLSGSSELSFPSWESLDTLPRMQSLSKHFSVLFSEKSEIYHLRTGGKIMNKGQKWTYEINKKKTLKLWFCRIIKEQCILGRPFQNRESPAGLWRDVISPCLDPTLQAVGTAWPGLINTLPGRPPLFPTPPLVYLLCSF